MFDYIAKAAIVWLIGFAPTLEVYIAVPAGMAMGLNTPSAIFWGAFGNFAAVPVILVFFRTIARIPLIRSLMDKRFPESQQARLHRWGPWFVFLMTPLVGVWVVAIAARVAGLNQAMILVASFVSIVIAGLAVGGVITLILDIWPW